MIKWLKELVKGSDFVVTKKKISVIALDPRAGKSYGEDIAGLFSDVADISVFSMLDGSAAGVLERADLFVASTDAYGSPEELAKHIPLDSQTMAIEVSFRWSELRKLKELPAGSKVLFVNMTETMAREAIAQLEQFGIPHIHWIVASYAPVVSGGAVWMLLRYGTMISSRRSCISNAAPLRHQSKAMPFMIVTTTSP